MALYYYTLLPYFTSIFYSLFSFFRVSFTTILYDYTLLLFYFFFLFFCAIYYYTLQLYYTTTRSSVPALMTGKNRRAIYYYTLQL